MLEPSPLKKGDQIRIICTARKISRDELQPAIDILKKWGLQVSLGKHLFAEDHQFAGRKQERLADIQDALDDPNCRAILCARGGYGTVQLIDDIDFSQFLKKPKWIVGYSDVTVLHNHINENYGIETIHATMPINFPKKGENESTQSIHKALFGLTISYEFQAEEKSILNFDEASAAVVGGNLSILYSLTGTTSQLSCKGRFLFMEDLDEYLYHIDRMLMNLKRAGLFEGCKGILVGGMSDMNDNAIPYGKTAKEIILENLRELGVPIIFGLPSGHIEPNCALIMGRNLHVKNNQSHIKLTFDGSTQ